MKRYWYFCIVLAAVGVNLILGTVGCGNGDDGDGDKQYCGNGYCEWGESSSNCPGDCGGAPPACGNGSCETGETESSCPEDCDTGPSECKPCNYNATLIASVRDASSGGHPEKEMYGKVRLLPAMDEDDHGYVYCGHGAKFYTGPGEDDEFSTGADFGFFEGYPETEEEVFGSTMYCDKHPDAYTSIQIACYCDTECSCDSDMEICSDDWVTILYETKTLSCN